MSDICWHCDKHKDYCTCEEEEKQKQAGYAVDVGTLSGHYDQETIEKLRKLIEEDKPITMVGPDGRHFSAFLCDLKVDPEEENKATRFVTFRFHEVQG